MSSITLSNKIVKQFITQAEREYPYECCGFILGEFSENGTNATEYIPADNSKGENRKRRFLIDPLAYQNAEDKADELGLSVISIVHSHPDHPDHPSEFDREHAWPGFSYIIISVQKGKSVSYKSWQLVEDRTQFNEEEISIKKEEE
jgi:proteasome lid subunit RPN8/RPN11